MEGPKNHWPDKALCPICGTNKVFEPHSMAIFAVNATVMDRESESTDVDFPINRLDLDVDLIWHGAHDGGRGNDREIYVTLPVFSVNGGCGELYFCSTACLRKFLNSCVDQLETVMQDAK